MALSRTSAESGLKHKLSTCRGVKLVFSRTSPKCGLKPTLVPLNPPKPSLSFSFFFLRLFPIRRHFPILGTRKYGTKMSLKFL